MRKSMFQNSFQNQLTWCPERRPLENVASPIYEEVGRKKAEEQAREALRRVGLKDELAEHFRSELSGGQQ
jgi:predicted ABC-type transport system involved in lysophospholipase L1 biosynthesis ATPase subunit